MKANHNQWENANPSSYTVSNGSKILKWKQITTAENLESQAQELFPMVQRY